MKEHRRAQRHKVRFKVVFDDGQTYSAGYVRDISRTGIFLQTANPLPVGSEVRLEPVDGADELFEVSAKVIRVVEDDEPIPDAETHANDGQIGMGLEFVDLDGAAGDGIERMVTGLEAAQRHKGNLDPFLGVYVEDAPVGGGPEAETRPARPKTGEATPSGTRDLEDELDAAASEDAAQESERYNG